MFHCFHFTVAHSSMCLASQSPVELEQAHLCWIPLRLASGCRYACALASKFFVSPFNVRILSLSLSKIKVTGQEFVIFSQVQSAATMRSQASKLPNSILVTSVSLSLLLVFFVYASKYCKLNLVSSPESTQKAPLQANQLSSIQNFKWSNELPGWTLARQPEAILLEEHRQQQSFVNQCLWPEDDGCRNFVRKQDRTVNQLLYKPLAVAQVTVSATAATTIATNGRPIKIAPPIGDFYPTGQELFLNEGCTVNKCQITYDNEEADAIVFRNSDVRIEPPISRRANQVWIAYLLESPRNTFDKRFKRAHRGKHEFNWTATYREDSDIVTPYSMFVPFEDQVSNFNSLKLIQQRRRPLAKPNLIDGEMFRQVFSDSSESHKNVIRNKRKPARVAWFASNCNAANNRLEYAKDLSLYLQVDIYGRCGSHTCDKWNQTGCTELLNRDYKFYLSFENSNCRQYLTEKLFSNAYGYNDLNHLVIPIVMGATKTDYELLAPPNSFIHVDDFESPEELANYLRLLDQDDSLYYSYFHWKTTGRFVDTKFMCRLCAMLHESHSSGKVKSQIDLRSWWNLFPNNDTINSTFISESCEPEAA